MRLHSRFTRYTVDFYWNIDGHEYEYSLAGGSSISFRELVNALHLTDGLSLTDGSKADSSEAADKFIADIKRVSFSDESLVKAVPITEESAAGGSVTAGELKEKLGLSCEYSAELTETEREAMDRRSFTAPDWALISLKAFDSEEYLTVAMKNGEEFRIRVTDAQIQRDYLSASGQTYTITVTYGEDAGIPEDADLEVTEILPGTQDYIKYMQLTAQRLGLETSGLSFARYFDITIVDRNGDKIEPKTPVQVDITYKDAVVIENDQALKIVHFAENGTEIISDAVVSENGKEISYQQDSFSVTGTIVGRPSNGQQRMIVLKDGNRYFIVNNDASLTEVGYEVKDGTPTVSVVEPMLWTFGGNNIYFSSEATGFNTNYTASDFYRRYLNPASNGGTTEEVSTVTDAASQVAVTVADTGNPPTWVNPNDGQTVHVNSVTNRQNALSQTSVSIETSGGTSTIRHGDTYFGIERDANGTPVRLVPQTGSVERAQFVFAEASEVPSGVHLQNAVNHIDIAINGDTEVNVPLAYGTYYLEDGTEVHILTNTEVALKKENAVDPEELKITADDMKRATIMAYDKDGNELDDAFYITGFSQNATTNLSEVQVRIEGAFKVAQPEKDNPAYKTIDGTRYDGNWWAWQMPDQNYVNAVRRARLNNIIDYRLTVIKPVTYQLVDSQGRKLYIDKDKTPLYVSVDVAFTGQFNYWDYGENEHNYGNECPPLENNPAWRAGDIPNHDLSGMDFRLKGSANDEDSPLVAVEIMKRIIDEKGNLITLGEPVTNYVDIYENKDADRNAVKDYKIDPNTGTNPNRDDDTGLYDGYTLLREKEITVDAGTAQKLIYDYNVSDAMYYIQEKSGEAELPETIVDSHHQEWTYVKTYIETEYVRRGYGGYDDKTEYPDPMHVSDDYTRGQEYKSSPEVVGWFLPVTGAPKKSGFLEYFIYNVYTQGRILDVEKQWALPQGESAPDGAVVEVEFYYAKGLDGQFPDKDQYQKVVAGTGPFDASLRTTVELTADNRWKETFADLPLTMEEGGTVYDLDYYAKEKSVKVPAAGKTEIDEDAIDLTNAYKSTAVVSDGKVTFRNEREDVRLDAEKVWAEGTAIPENAEVTVELRYATRTAVTPDGEVIAEADRTDWQPKSAYAPVKTTAGYAQLFADDPRFDETQIVTELHLSAADAADGVWKDAFTGLPKYLLAEDGSILEVDYYAAETAVRIPAEGRTAVDDDSPDIKDDYLVTVEKEEAEGQDADTSDGTVTITNKDNVTHLSVEKSWAKGITPAAGTEITVELRYAASMVTDKDGRAVDGAPTWPDKSEYTAAAKGETVQFTVDNTDPANPVTSLTVPAETTIQLKEDSARPEKSWVGSFEDLPRYAVDSEGNIWELDYYAAETAVKIPGEGKDIVDETAADVTDQYIQVGEKTEPGTAADGDGTVTITNKANIVVDVEKSWEDDPPAGASATVQLKRLKVSQTPDQIKTSATVVKVWDDSNNQDGIRPTSLTVTLRKNGEAFDTVELNSGNNWTATVSNLQAYDADGDSVAYTWTEDGLPEGYSLTKTTTLGTVTTLTNSYTPGKTSATVRIVWQDGNNRDALRPESVEVTLDQNGQKVILNEANNWTDTINGLPEKANGELIEYTWSAPNLEYYTKESEEEGDNQTCIIYTHEPETIEKKVRIVWDDTDNEDDVRPESVIVSVANDPTKTVTVSEPGWAGSVTLPKNENGQPITYTWNNPIIAEYTLAGTTEDPDGTVVMTYHHDLRPKKDSVTVTIHFILREAAEGYYTNWETNGWHTNTYNLHATYKGSEITMDTLNQETGATNLGWYDQSKYGIQAPISFEADKNSEVSFHTVAGGTDVELVGVNATSGSLTLTGSGNEREVKLTTADQDVNIYVVIKGREEKLPTESTVYMVVSQSGAYGIAKDPTDSVKKITVPVNSDVAFNYTNYYYAPWNQTINPKYEVYYWHETQYERKWELLSPPVTGDGAPDEDVIFNVGMKERYLILLTADPQFKNNFNCTLGSAETLNGIAAYSTDSVLSGRTADLFSIQALRQSLMAGARVDLPAAAESPAAVESSSTVESPTAAKLPTAAKSLAAAGNTSMLLGVENRAVSLTSPVTAPAGYSLDDYAEDEAFNNGTDPYTETVTLTLPGEDGWTASFPEQDKYDRWGRPYIYYVEEIDFQPEGYYTDSITGDPNAGDTVQIVNKKEASQTGSLKITKNVTVDGSPTEGTLADGTYTFTIKQNGTPISGGKVNGTALTGGQVTITISNGESSTVEVTDLPEGSYTITEADPVNGATLTGSNDLTATVEAGKSGDQVAADGIVSFTNNAESTNVTFGKNWSGTSDKDDTPVMYTLFQIAEPTAGGDPLYDNVYVGTCTVGSEAKTGTAGSPITFEVTKNSPVNVSGLPKTGVIGNTPVTYKYYAIEADIEGFSPDSPAAVGSGTFSLTNSPIPATATFEDVQVEKTWVGDGADSIGGYRFKLVQERAQLADTNAANSGAFHPIIIRRINGDGTSADNLIYYVAAGKYINVLAVPGKGANSGRCTRIRGSVSKTLYYNSSAYDRTLQATVPKGAYPITFRLEQGHSWSSEDWSIRVTEQESGTASTDPKTFISKLNNLNYVSTYDGQLVLKVSVPTATTATVDGNAYAATAENWKATVQKLPYYYYDSIEQKYYTYRYRVEELSIIDANGTELEAVVNNADGTAGESTHFTVEYDNSGTPLKITNTKKELVDIEASKTWKQPGADGNINETLKNAEVTFTLWKKVGETGTWAEASDIENYQVTMQTDDTADADAWKVSWTNLPKYENVTTDEGSSAVTTPTLVSYKIVESDAKINGTAITLPDTHEAEASDFAAAAGHDNPTAAVELTNTLPTTQIGGTKTWSAAGTHNNAEDITLKLTRTVGATTEVALDDGEKVLFVAPAVADSENNENHFLEPVWSGDSYIYSNLPMYSDTGEAYTYSVAEISFKVTINGTAYTYTVAPDGTVTCPTAGAPTFVFTESSNADGGSDFTNKEVTDFEFEKEWRLNEAVVTWNENVDHIIVTLTRSASGEGAPEDQTQSFKVTADAITLDGGKTFTEDLVCAKADGEGYRYTITGLDAVSEDGFEWKYSIEETAVKMADGDDVTGYNPARYVNADGAEHADDSQASGSKIINSLSTVELPSAGGPGTNMLYLLGLILLAFAFTGLRLSRRRA